MTATATADDDEPTPEVAALIRMGEPQLLQREAAQRAQFENATGRAMAAVREALEAEPGYHPSMAGDLQVADMDPDQATITVQLDLTGCEPITVVAQELRGPDGWAFTVRPGFWVQTQDHGDGTPHPTLAVAAAAARRQWVADQHEAEISAGGYLLPEDDDRRKTSPRPPASRSPRPRF